MTDKIWTRDEINNILCTNDRAVERAIVRLFELQNADEQRNATTNAHNNRGFASCDARAGTRFARWVLGMDDKNVKRYAPKGLNNLKAYAIFRNYCKNGESVISRARRIAIKHSRQLVDIANAGVKEEPKSRDHCVMPHELEAKFNDPRLSTAALYDGRDVDLSKEDAVRGPQPGTLAHTARLMASMDDSGFDWDAWKDEMKDDRLA
jgi:hypothetical protein